MARTKPSHSAVATLADPIFPLIAMVHMHGGLLDDRELSNLFHARRQLLITG
jgi:hypothetical protein